MADLISLLAAWTLAFTMARLARDRARHVRALQARLLTGGPPVDTYRMRCRCCGLRIKDRPVLAAVTRQCEGGPVTGVRVWHANVPRCSATTPDVLDVFSRDGGL